jgi:hypothetical protein
VTHRKRSVVEPDGHDTFRSIKRVTGIATTVRGRADTGIIRVKTLSVNRNRARSGLCGGCNVGNLSSLDGAVERVLPSLGH